MEVHLPNNFSKIILVKIRSIMTETSKKPNDANLFFVTMETIGIKDNGQLDLKIFQQTEVCDAFIRSLIYCIQNDIIKLYGFVILSDQIHLIISAIDDEAVEKLENLKECTSREVFRWMSKKISSMDNVKNKKQKELRKIFSSFLNMDNAHFWKKEKKFIKLHSKNDFREFESISSDKLLKHLTDENLNYLHLGASAFTKVMLHAMSA